MRTDDEDAISTTWLLCDYGEVLALAPSAADRAAENVLAARAAGLRATLFTSPGQVRQPAAHNNVSEDVGQ